MSEKLTKEEKEAKVAATREENADFLTEFKWEKKNLLNNISTGYEGLVNIAKAFKTANIQCVNATKLLNAIYSVVQGQPLPLKAIKVNDEWFENTDMFDENFLVSVGQILANRDGVSRLVFLNKLFGVCVKNLDSFRSKYNKMTVRINSYDNKKCPECLVTIRKRTDVKKTIDVLHNRIDFISKKFVETRKQILARVFGETEMMYGSYFSHNCIIDDGFLAENSVDEYANGLIKLDAKMKSENFKKEASRGFQNRV